jgi:hypothetical protein
MDLGNMLESIRIQTNRENMARQEEANRNKAASQEAKLKVVEVRKSVTEMGHEEAKTGGSVVKMNNSKDNHWRLKEEDQRGREVEPPQEVHGSQYSELGQQIQEQKIEVITEGQTQELEAGEKQKNHLDVGDQGEKVAEAKEVKNRKEEANRERKRQSEQLNKKLGGREMAEEKERGQGNMHGQKFRGHDIKE